MPVNKQKSTKRRTSVKHLTKKTKKMSKEDLKNVKGGANQTETNAYAKPGSGSGRIRELTDQNKLMEEEGIFYF